MAGPKNIGPIPTPPGGNPSPGQPEVPQSQDQRLEGLRQQQEAERTPWQEIVKYPKVFGEDEFQNLPDTSSQDPKPVTGLFSKLKRGTFLA